MTLSLRATKGKAVFEFEEDGMRASMELLASDTGPVLITKLDRMLSFLRRQKLQQASAIVARTPAERPVSMVSPLGGAGWRPPGTAAAFTGVPPVQAAPLADSLAKIAGSEWELYTPGNLED